MNKKKNYDLYKCYGLLKTMQEKTIEAEKLLHEVMKELNCGEDWAGNIDIHYNDSPIKIEDVKDLCEEYFNKE